MKALVRFAAWATLTFWLAWQIAHPWQRAIAGLAGRIAAPMGSEIEWVDLESFFPFDLSVYAALCLASSWRSWGTRVRSLGLGLIVLVAIELLAMVMVIRVMLGSAHQSPAQAEEAQRFVVAVIRLVGLVAAGCTWLYQLGWERLPQFASGMLRNRPRPRGGKR